ncbi:MAG: SoxR reducing system RseC family protein [Alphaproteobacteria bacterium]|nr:SoxR reducing system RseC family protein [Alphaproteobacteria bacterium]
MDFTILWRINLPSLSHSAEIIKIQKNSLQVKICRTEACSGCAIKSACQIKENSYAKLTIPTSKPSDYHLGQSIQIEISNKTGFCAIFYAYVLPWFLMLSTLLITIYISDNELLAGIFSIFVLVPYYIVLLLCKKTLNQKFSFKILEK